MVKVVTSLQNPLIKQILLLREKSRERNKQNLVVVEGVRESVLAAKAGHLLTALLYCEEILPASRLTAFFPPDKMECEIIRISVDVFNRLAYRKDNGGVIACVTPHQVGLEDLQVSGIPLILVVESVEKPGNLGAILRTADAAGVSAILFCDPQTDLFNPNTIRASLGTLFTNQVVVSSSPDALAWLKKRGIRIFAASLEGSAWYHEADYRKPSAIVLGSEASGLSGLWLTGSDMRIKIPMQGVADSLNVSTSAAILVFEAVRQRGFICTSHPPE